MFTLIQLFLVSIIIFLATIAGLSILFYRIFKNSSNTTDEQDATIKREWLRAFSILLSCFCTAVILVLGWAIYVGVYNEQIGTMVGTMASNFFILILFFGFTYYFGYFKRGTKFILCISIIEILQLFLMLPTIVLSSKFFIDSLVNSFSFSDIFPYSCIVIFIPLILASTIYYLINSIRLYYANRRFIKMRTNDTANS